MAKFKVKKIAKVSDVNNVVANNDIVNEVATTVANEIVNSVIVPNSESFCKINSSFISSILDCP